MAAATRPPPIDLGLRTRLAELCDGGSDEVNEPFVSCEAIPRRALT